MKAKYIFSAIALALISLTSCSDFLDEDPKGQLKPEGFIDSQKALDAVVNALYFEIQQSQCNSNPCITQCQGDDMTSTTGSNKAAYLFCHAHDAQGNVSDENIAIAKGQAYFWRAQAYFQLVRIFGPLPLNLHNEADGNATPLTPVGQVYTQIVSDLQAAEGCNLPAKYTKTNQAIGDMNIFVSEQAVKSALAAVYMNMAGFPMNKTEYYATAADKAKEVVDGGLETG